MIQERVYRDHAFFHSVSTLIETEVQKSPTSRSIHSTGGIYNSNYISTLQAIKNSLRSAHRGGNKPANRENKKEHKISMLPLHTACRPNNLKKQTHKTPNMLLVSTDHATRTSSTTTAVTPCPSLLGVREGRGTKDRPIVMGIGCHFPSLPWPRKP